MNRRAPLPLLALPLLFTVACDDGGDRPLGDAGMDASDASLASDASGDASTQQFAVGGSLVGLPSGQSLGVSLVVGGNVVDSTSVGADGTFTFGSAYPTGTTFALQIGTAPAGSACAFPAGEDGQSIVGAGATTDIAIACLGVPSPGTADVCDATKPTVQWAPVPGATGYQVVLSNGGTTLDSGVIAATSWQPNGVPPTGAWTASVVAIGRGITTAAGQTAFHVDTSPTPPPLPANASGCWCDTVSLDASSVTDVVYEWTGPGGFSSSASSIVIDLDGNHDGSYSLVLHRRACPATTPVTTAVATNNGCQAC